jgi:hypothetical protein
VVKRDKEAKMRKTLSLLIILFMMTSLCLALEKGKFGLNLRVDPAPRIGFTYHISNNFALRPSIGFSLNSTDAEADFETRRGDLLEGQRQSDGSNLNFGLGLLFYIHRADEITIYTGINLGYGILKSTVTFENRAQDFEDTGNSIRANALLGLQCQLLKNLGVFGEVGFGYNHTEFTHDNRADASLRQNQWGLINTGIGLIFYF